MTSFRALSGNRDFRVLWIGEMLSELGSSMSMFVFPLLTYALTGSATHAALTEFAHLLGLVLVLLPAGVVVDRVDRRTVLLAASASGLVLYGVLALAIAQGWVTLPLIAAVAGLTGMCSGFVKPAQMSAVRDVVPTELLPAAMSQSQARQHIGALLGAPLGGLLFGVARWIPFAADAVSYVASLVGVSMLRTDLSPVKREDSRVFADLRESFAFLRSRAYLRHTLALAFLSNITINAVFFAAVMRLVAAGHEPAAIGLVETVFGGTAILGALFAPALVERMRTGRLIVLANWAWVPLVVPLYFFDNPLGVGLCLSLGIVLNPASNAALGSYRMHLTPAALQGRVASTTMFVVMLGMPAAPLLGGVLLERAGALTTFSVLGAVLLASALLGSGSRAIRSVPRPAEWREQPAEVRSRPSAPRGAEPPRDVRRSAHGGPRDHDPRDPTAPVGGPARRASE